MKKEEEARRKEAVEERQRESSWENIDRNTNAGPAKRGKCRLANRINYVNLAEIFLLNGDLRERVKVRYLPPECGFPEPFNMCVEIFDVYKFPERVLEYAESQVYTNSQDLVSAAPVVRTYAPMLSTVAQELGETLTEIYGRMLELARPHTNAVFSYYAPESINFHLHHEGHHDQPPSEPQKVLAGIIYLEETFGTEMLYQKYYSQGRDKVNSSYYPPGSISHTDSILVSGGKKNSFAAMYSDVLHRPHYPGLTERDKKHGRLIQNTFFNDVTEQNISRQRESALQQQDQAVTSARKFDALYHMMVDDPQFQESLRKDWLRVFRLNHPQVEKWIDAKINEGYYDIMPSQYAKQQQAKRQKMIDAGELKEEQPAHEQHEQQQHEQPSEAGWLPPRSVVKTQFPFEDQLQEEPGAKETQQKLDEAENLKTYYDK